MLIGRGLSWKISWMQSDHSAIYPLRSLRRYRSTEMERKLEALYLGESKNKLSKHNWKIYWQKMRVNMEGVIEYNRP